MNRDELYHYGVLGMKWGIRRYQNKDGGYTKSGKRRYINDKTKSIPEKKRAKAAAKYGKKWDNNRAVRRYNKMSDDVKEINRIKSKKIYELSNNEIRKVNDRKQLEQNYSRLNPTTIAAGLALAGATIATLGKLNDNIGKIENLAKRGKKIVSAVIVQ